MDELEGYLRQPGFARVWSAVKTKYAQLGRIGGTVRLTDLTSSEADALAGLLAVNLYGQRRYALSLRDLDMALQQSKFRTSLVDALQHLFPGLQTNSEREQVTSENWREFSSWAQAIAQADRVKIWISGLHDGTAPGYRTFLDCYRVYSETGSCMAWMHAVKALDVVVQLEDGNPATVAGGRGQREGAQRLPIFAAQVTGDPHGLDRTTLAGKVFYWGLVALYDTDSPATTMAEDDVVLVEVTDSVGTAESMGAPSEQSRALYARAGILLDDVSSIVLVGNWAGFYEAPVAVPLLTLETMQKRLPETERVYIVENPSVFAELLAVAPAGIPIVCTSGQPSVAALRLLDMAALSGAVLYYSGDFDVKGLQMTMSLRDRYGNQLIPWRMDSRTYRRALSEDNPQFSETESHLLAGFRVAWDSQLVVAMLKEGRKVFQEHVVDVLVGDLM